MNRILNVLRIALPVAFIAALASCGGSSSSSSGGDVGVYLRDAEGDFLSYTVDVEALHLVRADGLVVDLLPSTTRIDFSQYVDLSELLNLARVPAGNYVSATMTVDFSTSDIEIADASGAPVQATAVDTVGNPLGVAPLTLVFNSGAPLHVVPGTPAALEIDFDLDSSSTIVGTSPAKVRVLPVLTARTQLDADRDRRLRGTLVATGADTLRLRLLPFLSVAGSGNFGTAGVATDADTVFEVDGAQATGDAGLALVAAEPAGTPLVVTATASGAGGALVASRVEAGSSVPWANRDYFDGAVLARTGSVLHASGRLWNHVDHSVTLHASIDIDLASSGLTLAGESPSAPVTAASFSVGSRLQAFGQWAGGTPATLDVTNGYARRAPSQFTGTVTANAAPFLVDVHRLDGRLPQVFDFAGTGSSVDADPSAFAVDTGALAPTASVGDVVRVRGHVADFGAATPSSDFIATGLWDLSTDDHSAVFGALWGPLATPVVSATGDLVLDAGAAIEAGVRIAGIDQALPGGGQVTLSGANGLYVTRQGTSLQMYGSFAAWESAVSAAVNGGGKLVAVRAAGRYDGGAGTFTTVGAFALLSP